MCGIAGIYKFHGEASESALQAMAQTLAHRGPDDAGVYCADRTGLAHTRLSIIDLTTGHQPLYSQDRTLVLVANGEIYNHVELRQTLEQRGHVFTTRSDCETILYAYREYGMDFVQHLCGMFAFALYDTVSQQLILARDRLGIKPLFIMQQADGICFASELKALFTLLSAKPSVNPAGLAQFLQANFTTGRTTLVEGIERLLPGEVMIINADGHTQRKTYWSLHNVTPRECTFDQAAEEFDELMHTVITQHMRTDVPFGLYLSGGVDSSVLLALLSRHAGEPLHTYSVGFPHASVHNELPAALAMAQRFNTQHTVLELEEATLLQRLPHALWSADELMGDYANLPVSMLAQRTAQDIKVVFSGEGGDEVFAGYGRYRMPALKRWLRALRAPGSGGFRTRGMFDRTDMHALFTPALQHAMHDWRQVFIDSWRNAPRGWSILQRMQAVDMQTWLADDLLVKADRMLMAWGVEGRVPLLDHRVVEFGLALPDVLKANRRNGKIFLKRWAQRYLPEEHLWTHKRGFTVPVRDWLSGALLDQMEQALLADTELHAWFRPAGIKQLIASQRGNGNYSQPLWALLQFALWQRMFIHGDMIKPAPLQDPLSLLR